MAVTEHRVDCRDGSAVDLLLDDDEAALVRSMAGAYEEALRAGQRRAQALARLRFSAVTDATVADILTVLGLDDG